MFRNLSILIALLASSYAWSQPNAFFKEDNTTKAPNHIEFALGVTNFLGDLGGKDGIGSNDFKDLEFTEFNFGAMIGYRRAILKNLYFRTDFAYGRVSGNDNLTQEVFRRNRNLHFRSDIFEVDFMPEIWIRIGGKKGHQFNLDRAGGRSGPWKVRASYLTVFGGLGYFHFNPKAEYMGRWVELNPLHTEGQTYPGGPEAYRLWGWNVPVGINYMVKMSKKWGFGIEMTYRYTFTDYIDDVSGVYYNPADIKLYDQNNTGDMAAYLSNPSLGLEDEGLGSYVTAPGQQRGDPTDRDGYMYAMIKIDYWFDEEKDSKLKWSHKGSKKKRR